MAASIKTKFIDMLPTETHFSLIDTYRITMKEWGKSFQANSNQKKGRGVILISNNTNFNLEMVKRDRNKVIA